MFQWSHCLSVMRINQLNWGSWSVVPLHKTTWNHTCYTVTPGICAPCMHNNIAYHHITSHDSKELIFLFPSSHREATVLKINQQNKIPCLDLVRGTHNNTTAGDYLCVHLKWRQLAISARMSSAKHTITARRENAFKNGLNRGLTED